MSSGNRQSGATAGQVRSRAIGALFFIGFGEVWLLLGLSATPYATALTQALCCVIGFALLAAAFALMRRAKHLPADRPEGDSEERSRLMFRAVNIIQWVSIATAASILAILHLPEYLVTAIAVIVGLHLFPLAESFRYRQHYVTGALMVAWPLGCLAVEPRSQVSAVTALGAGIILLLSAAATLVRNIGVWGSPGGPLDAISGHPAA